MANSNGRVKECGTVHHLVSRIAHRVYFLKDEERMDFLEIVRRAAEFTGIQLIGWCVMGNHFHILAFLPEFQDVAENEVVRRYGVLRGLRAAESMTALLGKWRSEGEAGERRASEWLDGQRRRMQSVGSFMKIAKQWFTTEYNRRNGHKGTLWEAAYFDRVVPRKTKDMAECLGYIHLNPIRAAATDRLDGYAWSSYSAFRKGEPIATAGMRFVYGGDVSVEEMVEAHERLLCALLEKEKQRRAEEIARRRADGYEVAPDPLTTEAMVVQTEAHLAEVRQSLRELHEAGNTKRRGCKASREGREKEIVALLKIDPLMSVPALAERLEVGVGMAYNLLRCMKKRGILERDRRSGIWNIENEV